MQQLKLLLGPLFIIFIAEVASYMLNISLAQVVDTTTYGKVAFGLTIASLLSVLIDLGGTDNATRFLSSFLNSKDKTNAERFVVWHVNRARIPIILSLLCAIVIYFIIEPIEYYYFQEVNPTLHLIGIACILGPLYASLDTVSSYLICDNKVILSQFVSSILYNVIFLAVVLLYIMLEYSFTEGILPVAFHIIFFEVMTLVIGILLLKLSSPHIFTALQKSRAKKRSTNKEWNTSAKGMCIMSILLTVSDRIDFIAVGLLIHNPKSLAYYFAAQTTCLFILMFPGAFFISISNHIDQAFKSKQSLASFIPKWRFCMLANLICIALLSVFLGLYKDLIPTMYGSSYIEAYYLLCIMLLGYGVNGIISIPYSDLLSFSGHVNVVSKAITARLAIFVIIMAILIPTYGITGIAIAYTIAECTRALFMIFLNLRTTPARPFFIF